MKAAKITLLHLKFNKCLLKSTYEAELWAVMSKNKYFHHQTWGHLIENYECICTFKTRKRIMFKCFLLAKRLIEYFLSSLCSTSWGTVQRINFTCSNIPLPVQVYQYFFAVCCPFGTFCIWHISFARKNARIHIDFIKKIMTFLFKLHHFSSTFDCLPLRWLRFLKGYWHQLLKLTLLLHTSLLYTEMALTKSEA